MRKIYLALGIIITTLVLSGCKNAPEISVINASKKIGFISLLRDEFHIVYVGTTVFTNKTHFAKTPNWSIGRYAENYALGQIRKNQRFNVSRARYNKAELRKIYIEGMNPFGSKGAFKTELNRIAGQQGYDTLVVLGPTTLDQVMLRNPAIGEYGLYHRYEAILDDELCTFAKYELMIYNLKKKEIIGRRLTSSTRYSQSVARCRKDSAEGENGVLAKEYGFKEKFSAYTAAQKTAMKKKIQSQFASRLKKDIECLKLKPLKNGKYRDEGCGLF